MDEQATDQANKQPDKPEQEPTTEDILPENLSNDAIRFINKIMQGGHADSRHVNRSVVDVLDRTLKNAPPKEQKKNFSSNAFASPNDFYDYVTKCAVKPLPLGMGI